MKRDEGRQRGSAATTAAILRSASVVGASVPIMVTAAMPYCVTLAGKASGEKAMCQASTVFFDVDLDPARTHGRLERCVVALRLVGVGDSEIAHCFVER